MTNCAVNVLFSLFGYTLISDLTQALQLTAVNNLDDIGLRQIAVLSDRINIAGIINLKDIFATACFTHSSAAF